MHNILLTQFIDKNNNSTKEIIPKFSNKKNEIKFLTFENNNLKWSSIKSKKGINIHTNKHGNLIIDCSLNILNTEIYFEGEQIGIGRKPLYNYKVDIGVPENTLTTALHIGDGKYGFSLGNATKDGFLPQIIGVGSDEHNAGLYFLGKVSTSEKSNIPAIIIDGRNLDNKSLINRPILGICSGKYSKFDLLLTEKGQLGLGKYPSQYKMEINGVLMVHNIMIDTSNNILNLKQEIQNLKKRILILEKNK